MSTTPKKLLTEDLGLTLEYAICLLNGTTFEGDFKYSKEKASGLADKLKPHLDRFSGFEHSGKKSNLYDFTHPKTEERGEHYLSIKTTKNKGSWKVCPQIIGQTTLKRFCAHFKLESKADVKQADLAKEFIEMNLPILLEDYTEKTFHCPVVFYNEAEGVCKWIELKSPIDWSAYTFKFSHQLKEKTWNESATVYVDTDAGKPRSIGEFQVHNHRDCIKFRFDLKALLNLFPDNFHVEDLFSKSSAAGGAAAAAGGAGSA